MYLGILNVLYIDTNSAVFILQGGKKAEFLIQILKHTVDFKLQFDVTYLLMKSDVYCKIGLYMCNYIYLKNKFCKLFI